MTLVYYSDDSHGWLEVPKTLIRKFGVHVSGYSYLRGETAYLEEDCDAPRFLEAAKSSGYAIQIQERRTDGQSSIRNYQPYC